MLSHESLYLFLTHSAESWPENIAVREPGDGSISYKALDALSDKVRDWLFLTGVVRGDRVGIYLRKSIDSVASIFGILKTGAAYVPVDPGAPVARNGYILNDCSVKAIIVEKQFEEGLRSDLDSKGFHPALLVLDEVGGGKCLDEKLNQELAGRHEPGFRSATPNPDDLAYILYTSGSTGRPKGVMLTHRDAISYVDWCSEIFEPDEKDRFSSHAPFHFDLSILDIYVPIKHGAMLVLIGEEVGKDPMRLAPLIEQEQITSWYSTPSILSFLVQYGQLQNYDYSALRTILFAGEVFPVKYLRELKNLIPHPRYFNLYGPTETNVCTYYEIPREIPENRTEPYPIGKRCSHLQTKVVNEAGEVVPAGEEGELWVSGPGVMEGYWNLPERTASAFQVDSAGGKWYKTGDVVIEQEDQNYKFLGRRDRMVKKRGYRVELGEIESALYRNPAIKEAATIALADDESGVRIKAFVSFKGDSRLSIIELKRFCSENLPMYMVPDFFSIQEILPKTSTDKVDYQKLKELD
jgi:amino acid adenylation domain-containing protein